MPKIVPKGYVTDAASEPWRAGTYEDVAAVVTEGGNLVTCVADVHVAMVIAAEHNAIVHLRHAIRADT